MNETRNTSAAAVRQWMAPDYWPEFHCLMGECRQSCCDANWNITMDRGTYLKIKQTPKPPELEAKVKGSLRRIRGDAAPGKYAVFNMGQQGVCPFLGGDKLCALQCACGEGILPEVCRVFPRHEDFWMTGYAHKSCSVGCEATLRLLWERRDGLGFLSEPLEKTDWRETQASVSQALLEEYPAIWELCIDILQDRRVRLSRRIIALGALVKNMAAHAEQETPRWRGWAAVQRDALGSVYPALEKLPGNRKWFLASNVALLNSWTLIGSIEKDVSDRILKNLEGELISAYCGLEDRMGETFGDLDWFFENILVNQFFQIGLPMGNLEPQKMWKYYLQYCCICFSFMKFCAVAYAPQTREELFDILVHAGRSAYHSTRSIDAVAEQMNAAGSDTLAFAAILTGD